MTISTLAAAALTAVMAAGSVLIVQTYVAAPPIAVGDPTVIAQIMDQQALIGERLTEISGLLRQQNATAVGRVERERASAEKSRRFMEDNMKVPEAGGNGYDPFRAR